MKPIVINKDGEMIKPTDWQKKAQDIIQKLDEEIFNKLKTRPKKMVEAIDENGEEIMVPDDKPQKYYKNSIMPIVQPLQVANRLNRHLRIYKPMTFTEAKDLSPEEYIQAYTYFCDIIFHINQFVNFVADKQLFSGFINTTVDVYNDLLGDSEYSSTFRSFDDSFISDNYISSQSGLVDSKTALSKLQTKDAGHSLIKSPESVVYNISNKVDQQQVLVALEKFDSITKKLPNSKN